jgi:hypothetical protein
MQSGPVAKSIELCKNYIPPISEDRQKKADLGGRAHCYIPFRQTMGTTLRAMGEPLCLDKHPKDRTVQNRETTMPS